ncbi:major facilitator superfamily domain-containing protein [Xylariomycetidae sp. FL0641]|nr:major facilitator superfamily domain-containing protein [Xylariomycetidae sp. FL0641]
MATRVNHRDEENSEVTEYTPLVGKSSHGSRPGSSSSRRRGSIASIGSAIVSAPQLRSPNTIVNALCLGVFIACAAGPFQTIPMTRIYEDILCSEYYDRLRSRGRSIDEDMCKVDDIQSKLAYLFATWSALNAGISIAATLPWGIMADRMGRKPVCALSLLGMALAQLLIMAVAWFRGIVPVHLVWMSSVAYLCGGGDPTVSAALTGMVTDVVDESKRSVSYMRLHAASMLGNLVAPALASAMMSRTGPWPVMFVSLVLVTAPIALLLFLPETVQKADECSGETQAEPHSLKESLQQNFKDLIDSLSVLKIPSVLLIFCIVMLEMPTVVCTFQFMTQFVSKRYHIPLAKTGYVQSVYGIAHLIVVLVIVPLVSAAMVNPSMPGFLRITNEKRRDLLLARWSYAAVIIGTFVLGISPSLADFVFGLVVMSLGSAAASCVQGTAVLYVDEHHRSSFFSLLALTKFTGNLWGSPALAGLFSAGMKLGGMWIGLPYFGVSGLAAIMLTIAMFVTVPIRARNDERSGDNVDGEIEGLLDTGSR